MKDTKMPRTPDDLKRMLLLRALAVGVVLYWLYEIVVGFFRGGPEAPSLTLLILALVVLGGGAVLIAVLTYRFWKQQMAALQEAKEEPEE